MSGALELMDARCVIAGGFSAGGAWATRSRPQARLKLVAPVKGSCWLIADHLEPVLLDQGDVAVLTDRDAIVLASDPGVEPVETAGLFGDEHHRFLRLSQEDHVQIIGGHVALNHAGQSLLLSGLPPVSCIRAHRISSQAVPWLLQQLAREIIAGLPGSDFAARQYSQLVLVEVLRAHMDQAGSLPSGWLRAAADDRIGPALRLVHAKPGHRWTLAELAKATSMSRTSFASRFTAVAGLPPLAYIHAWRMHIAARALRHDSTPIPQLSRALGYSSESAFNTAFKRTIGASPGRYRSQSRHSQEVTSPAGNGLSAST